METRVLKEPRGFMRILQWFAAIFAFATCCDFSTVMEYTVHCTSGANLTINHTAAYPFRLGQASAERVVMCPGQGTRNYTMAPPGDFASDAQFFVFTGVVSWLATMALLVVYVFFSPIYDGADKRAPTVDFIFTLILGVFWISASAAWANGLVAIKSIFGGDWIFHHKGGICDTTDTGSYVATTVKDCVVNNSGSFGGANVSVIFGFLNFFLWGANLWFLYKETPWFAGRAQQPTPQNLEG